MEPSGPDFQMLKLDMKDKHVLCAMVLMSLKYNSDRWLCLEVVSCVYSGDSHEHWNRRIIRQDEEEDWE